MLKKTIIYILCTCIIISIGLLIYVCNTDINEHFQSQSQNIEDEKKYETICNNILNKYGPTYYKSLDKMTEKQKDKYLKNVKYENMTIGDYINYIILKKQKLNNLNEHETNILNKIINGKTLILSDIPKMKSKTPPPPLNSEQYYNNFLEKNQSF
jgi:hypothetical protein